MQALHDIFDTLADWADDFPVVWKLVLAALLLLLAGATARIVNRVIRRTYWRRIAIQEPERIDELRRSQRQQTLLTLLESLVRYTVYGTALVLAFVTVTGNDASKLFGAGLIVVVVGFGMQRLLVDVVSGGLLLFEGHIAVGDFVSMHQPTVSGVVEQFSLRTTTLRTLAGDRVMITNGSITNLTRANNGYRDYRIELIAREPAEARAGVQRVVDRTKAGDGSRFLLGPAVTTVEPLDDGNLVRVELRAVVPPSLEVLVEETLRAHLEYELGESLVGGIAASAVSEGAFDAYRKAVIVRA